MKRLVTILAVVFVVGLTVAFAQRSPRASTEREPSVPRPGRAQGPEKKSIERIREVIELKHTPASDVANSISELLRSERPSPMDEVVIVPQPIGNRLLISSPPSMFDEIMELIEGIDVQPRCVVIETLIAGGEIKTIEKEEVNGQVIYDVEASVGGKDVEYDVASDGTVLTAEESVSYASLPAAVQVAAQRYCGSATELKGSREVEQGKAFYEVEGQKKGKAVALNLTDAGHIVEEERQ